jgi:membrane protease YdiL (CAAX protease family)
MKHCSNDACPDLLRNGFRSEYLDHVETCPECDGRLTTGPAPPPPSPRSQTTEWVDTVCVATFSDLPSAQVARASLESAGIPAVVQHEHMQGFYPGAIAARLCVPPEHAEAAARVLASDDAELVEDVAIDDESHSVATEEEPQQEVASPYLTTETLAIFVITCGYPLLWNSLYDESASLTVGDLISYAVWDLGWVLLLCALMTRDRTFAWNLPATRTQWLAEVAWGVALFFVGALANELFADLARSRGLESAPPPWEEWLKDPDVRLAFLFAMPLAVLHEELLFRVYLQTRLTRFARGWSLVTVPFIAFWFAMTHDYAPVETAAVFGFGLVLGISYQVSRSVPRVVIAHAISWWYQDF